MDNHFGPPAGAKWQRSSRCVGDTHCVEVAADRRFVYLRNSRTPDNYLRMDHNEWSCFLDRISSTEAAA
jgi:hypothetical protein